MNRSAYNRVLLKISGESLSGEGASGIDPSEVDYIAQQAVTLNKMGKQLAVVVGGGNIIRGAVSSARGMNRAAADHMGMLATVINGLALQDAIEAHGIQTRVMSAIHMEDVAEPFIRRRAIRHLEKGRVVILVAGTGNPYFTTDTTAALRANEICADVLLKATKVDGVYSGDPKTDPTAKRYEKIAYMDVLTQQLKVMDSAAISLCMENKVPIIVFNMGDPANFEKAMAGEPVGTYVGE